MNESNRNYRIAIGILVLIILTLLINNCNDVGSQEKVRKPSQTISREKARVLQKEFVRTRSGILNKALGFEDTRDFWFSLDTLEQYISYVRQESKTRGLEDLGIRIYYAAYPKDGKGQWPDPGFSTVVLVPTHGKPSIGNGFFPMPPIQDDTEDLEALNYGNGGHPPN
ncbi:MAG: hypothetical protein AAGA86_06710 [Bacteroidota bacterium]